MSIVGILLVSVGFIGLTFPPFENLAHRSYNFFEPLGMNPSFTPLTFDMSMMSTKEGKNLFAKKIELYGKTSSLTELIPPKVLNLYKEKIPIILFFEQIQDGKLVKELLFAICQRLGQVMNKKYDSFMINIQGQDSTEVTYRQEFHCD